MNERWRLFGTKKRRRGRYEVREKEKPQIEAQRSGFNLEKEEQGSVRMTPFSAVGIKRRRSKADFAPTWLMLTKKIPAENENSRFRIELLAFFAYLYNAFLGLTS